MGPTDIALADEFEYLRTDSLCDPVGGFRPVDGFIEVSLRKRLIPQVYK